MKREQKLAKAAKSCRQRAVRCKALRGWGVNMPGGLGGVGGLALFLVEYAMFQTATRPPSGGVDAE
jgi:hypothetical protein